MVHQWWDPKRKPGENLPMRGSREKYWSSAVSLKKMAGMVLTQDLSLNFLTPEEQILFECPQARHPLGCH